MRTVPAGFSVSAVFSASVPLLSEVPSVVSVVLPVAASSVFLESFEHPAKVPQRNTMQSKTASPFFNFIKAPPLDKIKNKYSGLIYCDSYLSFQIDIKFTYIPICIINLNMLNIFCKEIIYIFPKNIIN
jgi:hypothetical protein